jgi:hypothetical protein
MSPCVTVCDSAACFCGSAPPSTPGHTHTAPSGRDPRSPLHLQCAPRPRGPRLYPARSNHGPLPVHPDPTSPAIKPPCSARPLVGWAASPGQAQTPCISNDASGCSSSVDVAARAGRRELGRAIRIRRPCRCGSCATAARDHCSAAGRHLSGHGSTMLSPMSQMNPGGQILPRHRERWLLHGANEAIHAFSSSALAVGRSRRLAGKTQSVSSSPPCTCAADKCASTPRGAARRPKPGGVRATPTSGGVAPTLQGLRHSRRAYFMGYVDAQSSPPLPRLSAAHVAARIAQPPVSGPARSHPGPGTVLATSFDPSPVRPHP